MNLPFFLVDAFTVPTKPFSGNPAGVVPLSDWLDDGTLQCLAHKIRQAETAFFVPLDQENEYELRWFTPESEVDLCGHATLAALHVLTHQDIAKRTITFHTRSGALVCHTEDGVGVMSFPREEVHPEPLPDSAPFSDSQVLFSGKNRMDWLVVMDSIDSVKNYQPSWQNLAAMGQRAVIITAQAGDPTDRVHFVSRVFAPNVGIFEDAVTGSAHCALGPYWANHLGIDSVMGLQLSQETGLVACELEDDRVLLVGQCHSWCKGELHLEKLVI
ncbi:MAG: PhzF family phenazine biosynthesis protein [Fimbriimonadaceae bacterium]|jgi:predicted PhzF superfamily epimerase YddE/YHI9|nr:PhzF family phenazine biosynthesis protein [Fimbriimonadaceae bacterium]